MLPPFMPPSDFQIAISRFPVPLIVERIGCGKSVAYAWQAGDRTPEPWQQTMILERMGDPPAPVEAAARGRGRPRKDSGPGANG